MRSALLIALVVLCAAVVLLVLQRRRPAPHDLEPVGEVPPLPDQALVPTGTLDVDALLSSLDWPLEERQQPILVDLQDGTALVLGERRDALAFGEVIGTSGTGLVSAARYVANAARAGTEAAERTGHLVRVHPDSVKALRDLKPDQVKDAAGYFYGTLRGSKGQYKHVIRLKDAANLQTLSSGAAVLSALATQAQLDRIERQLGQLQSSVGGVQRTLDASAQATRAGLDSQLGEIYRTAQKTGQLTPAQWDQVAPIIGETYKLREATLLAQADLLRQMAELPPKAKDRRERMDRITSNLQELMDRLDADDRRVGQAQALRLWHLSVAGDPSLPATLADTRQQIDERLDRRNRVLAEIEATVGDPDVKGLQRIHTKTRAQLRESGFALSQSARERRLALPQRLAIGWADPSSPEDVALDYSLNPDEAVALAAAQCWLMSQCAESQDDHNDVSLFVRSTVEAVTSTDRGALSESSQAFVRRLEEVGPDGQAALLADFESFRRLVMGSGSRVRSLLVLIELWSFHPWTPTDPTRPLKTARKWDEKRRTEAIRQIASAMDGVAEDDAGNVKRATAESMRTLFQGAPTVAVALLLVAGVGAGALTAGLAAPAIGAAVGGTLFGLSGAAATSAGLAALGGGSLAAGGLGMAGGTALISAAGGLLGLGVGAGAAAGTNTAVEGRVRVLGRLVSDVVKLHVLCKVVLIDELRDLAALDTVIGGMRNRREEVQLLIAENRSPDRLEAPDEGTTNHEGLPASERNLAAAAARKEEAEQLRTLDQALERAIADLLKRRGAILPERSS